SVFAVPSEVKSPEHTATVLAEVLEQPLETVQRRLATKSSFVWLSRQTSPQIVTRLQQLQLPGIHFRTEMRRYYPNHHLAGQLLGFVGIDGQGLGGLEYRYDQALTAEPRRVRSSRDAKGRQVRLSPSDIPEMPRGADLHVTLDERLQYVAEKEIAAQVRLLEARSGLVMVMQPHTGDVLAMASYPFFNPNAFQDASQHAWHRNRGLTDPVEPGSTFKVVLAAAAIEEAVIQPEDRFFCENGMMQRGRRQLHDYKPHGYLSFADVFAYSSNIGAVKIAERITPEQFYDYIRRLGFGERTRIDLPGEHHGQVRPPQQWSGFSHDSLALGQEIAVTPIQLIRAFAAIANGGWLVQPRVVSRLVRGDDVRVIEPEPRRRVLSRRTTQQLTAILTDAVTFGTGQSAAIEGYSVAGKTGTAQKVDPVNGGYSHWRVLTSFVGYVPTEDPQIVILVMIDEPQRLRWGSQAAAPVFQRVAQQALHYLQIPPLQPPASPLPATPARTLAGRHAAHPAVSSAPVRVVSLPGTR
ncbi:MAG: penicillin-binding protein 2, partial [Candidatus Tectomicrobia bacterium]|nr:penicillin-binding protein 2 [Candidatus Tectomicrobia bacterium]